MEIHCHGNPIIVSGIFSWLEGLGVREAERGEFSKRAYLNEKITLDQAWSSVIFSFRYALLLNSPLSASLTPKPSNQEKMPETIIGFP